MVFSPTQFARYERLWEQVCKQRNASADKVEALLEILESYVDEDSGRAVEPQRSARAAHQPNGKPPVQIHIHQCPDCAQATVQTSKGELAIGAVELERAQCDCQISAQNKRNSTSIPPAVRRQVLALARHKCQSPGCDHTQFLEVHHKVPRSLGGSNNLSNLQVRCSGCHKLLHENMGRGAGFMVKSRAEVYSWGASGTFSPISGSHSPPRNTPQKKPGCSER